MTRANVLDFVLKADVEKLSADERGPHNGPCAMHFAGEPFPNSVWEDFPIVIVEWWLREVVTILGPDSTAYGELEFMEGPYMVRLKRTAGRVAEFELRGPGWWATPTRSVDLQQMLSELVRVGQKLVDSVRPHRPKEADLDALEASLRSAKGLLDRF